MFSGRYADRRTYQPNSDRQAGGGTADRPTQPSVTTGSPAELSPFAKRVHEPPRTVPSL